MVETWNEVGPTNYILGVKEAKCAVLEARDEFDAIELLRFPSSLVGFVNSEPTNPEDVHHLIVHHRRSMENVESEYSEDPRIHIWVGPVLREGHHV